MRSARFAESTECSGVQPSAELTSQVLRKALKFPKTKVHVVRAKSINNVVVNKLANLYE